MTTTGGSDDTDRRLEEAIVTLLAERRSGATICPSEAARRVGGDADEAWRPLMEAARAAAARLVREGRVEVTQAGEVVDLATARGPVRVRQVGAPSPDRPD